MFYMDSINILILLEFGITQIVRETHDLTGIG